MIRIENHFKILLELLYLNISLFNCLLYDYLNSKIVISIKNKSSKRALAKTNNNH